MPTGPGLAILFRYFASVIRAEEGGISEIDKDTYAYHFREPLGVVGQIIPFNFPLLMAAWKLAPALAAGNCVGAQAGQPDSVVDPEVRRADRRHRPARRAQHRERPRRRDRQGAGVQQANRQDRLHRRDGDRTADHAIRRPEHHPVDDRARRQVAEHLLRRRDGRRRRVPRQGGRGPRALRLQQGRGLHLPVEGPDRGVDLRRVHGALPGSDRADPPGQPARSLDADRPAGLGDAAREDRELREDRPRRGRRAADRRQARPRRQRARGRLLLRADRLQGPQRACGSSRRRSSARCWP